VVLAGGDGTRLKSLTERIVGDDRPKQFCAIVGRETLLERTRRRMELLVRPDRHIVVVTRAHAPYWAALERELAPGRLVVQPSNQGTLAGILYPIFWAEALGGNPVVVVTPSDHEVAEDRGFMAHVAEAATMVDLLPDLVVVLGIEAETAEPEYGWIEPVRLTLPEGGPSIFPISRFVEKPTPAVARRLFERGCLWNSFVMVGRASAFIDLVREAVPDVLAQFAPLEMAIGAEDEMAVAERVYARLTPMSFSDRVLAAVPARLLALPVKGVGWSDWGSPPRVLASLRRSGRRLPWMAGIELASTA